jgi:hypothetical protein
VETGTVDLSDGEMSAQPRNAAATPAQSPAVDQREGSRLGDPKRRQLARKFLEDRLAEWNTGPYQAAIRDRPPPKHMVTNNLFPFLTRWSEVTQTNPIPEHYAHITVYVRVDPAPKSSEVWSLTAKGTLSTSQRPAACLHSGFDAQSS